MQIGAKESGGPIDISDLLFRYTLDAATHFLLGRSVGSLELPEQPFAAAFSVVQHTQSIISRAGYVCVQESISHSANFV